MNTLEQSPGTGPKEWWLFESLLAELSTRFVNLPPEQVDVAIEDVQRAFCERLELDRSTLFQCLEADTSRLLLTHVYQRPGLPYPLIQKLDPVSQMQSYWRPPAAGAESSSDGAPIDAKVMYPWFYAQLARGQTVVVPDLEALGTEADRDKEHLRAYGTQSTVVVPLFTGKVMLGMLTFGTVRQCRSWPEDLVKRFELIAGLFTNALARKRADEMLRESEARFRTVADSAPVLIWTSGPDKLCNHFNQTWLDFTGRTLEQELGNGWAEGVHPEDFAACLKTYGESFDARRPFLTEYRLRRRDGEYRWIADRGVPRYEADGKFAGYIGSCVDITEQRKSRERLRAAATEWQTTFDAIPHPVMLLNLERKITRANAAALSSVVDASGLVGQLCSLPLRERCDPGNCPWEIALKSKRHEEREIYADKQRRWFREIVDPILDESHNVTGLVFALEDITERKLAEEKLRKSLVEIEDLRNRLQAEADYLKSEIKTAAPLGIITGESAAIKRALAQAAQVAPTGSTVLLCGETGVGKELFAEAIHRLSPRKDHVLIRVNCAALPSPLVESELFGREKGAYTGALTRQAGRFEIADNSSLFLDEVGELSPEVQAKLLRVLQDGQFERLGSPRTLKVNVRLIAATNRDLAQEVRKGRFRQDLFYRLNVFPIQIPPLRERQEDIPRLVWTFVQEFSTRMGRKITKIARKHMDAMHNYSWPGNVRELRNFVERSVIISSGETLHIAELPQMQETLQQSQPLTLAETEREHILKILESTLWHIKGPHGAARKLGLHPSTLYTRMQKLGIPNRSQKDNSRI